MTISLDLYYNWQFLRRNQEYQSDYLKYISAVELYENESKLGSNEIKNAKLDEPEFRNSEFIIRGTDVPYHLIMKWGINSFENFENEVPSNYFAITAEPVASYGPYSYKQLFNSSSPNKESFPLIDNFLHIAQNAPVERDLGDDRFLVLVVDLGRYKSKQHNPQKIISEYVGNQKAKKYVCSRDNLDRVLLVYDEKIKGETNYRIANKYLKLFQRDDSKGRDANDCIRQVNQDYEKALDLIKNAPFNSFNFADK